MVDGIQTVKFVFISWVGENVKPMTKGKISTHKSTVEKAFHVSLIANIALPCILLLGCISGMSAFDSALSSIIIQFLLSKLFIDETCFLMRWGGGGNGLFGVSYSY